METKMELPDNKTALRFEERLQKTLGEHYDKFMTMLVGSKSIITGSYVMNDYKTDIDIFTLDMKIGDYDIFRGYEHQFKYAVRYFHSLTSVYVKIGNIHLNIILCERPVLSFDINICKSYYSPRTGLHLRDTTDAYICKSFLVAGYRLSCPTTEHWVRPEQHVFLDDPFDDLCYLSAEGDHHYINPNNYANIYARSFVAVDINQRLFLLERNVHGVIRSSEAVVEREDFVPDQFDIKTWRQSPIRSLIQGDELLQIPNASRRVVLSKWFGSLANNFYLKTIGRIYKYEIRGFDIKNKQLFFGLAIEAGFSDVAINHHQDAFNAYQKITELSPLQHMTRDLMILIISYIVPLSEKYIGLLLQFDKYDDELLVLH